jgi:hypothetical protein
MFDRNYLLYGKHAKYVRFLNAYTRNLDKSANVAGIFPFAVDVILVAPLIGVAYNLRSPVDNDINETLSVMSDQFITRQTQFENIYRLVMLSEKSIGNLSSEDRINRAFRDDEEPEKLEENMELFYQYMRGGIEWLYEKITDGATTRSDYLEKISEIVKLYVDDFEISQNEPHL